MQMIDVLKRLAELDSENPRVEKTLTQEQSLTTISNVSNSLVNENLEECGSAMSMSSPRTPASLSVTAGSGDELANMLHSLMKLSGSEKSSISSPMHQEIELGTPHIIEPESGNSVNGDMNTMLSLISKNDSEKPSPTSFDNEPKKKESWNNSPEPEVEPHDYGDRQVKPKQQGLKQRVGDNPYTPTDESVDQLAKKLMRDYKDFVAESVVSEISQSKKLGFGMAATDSANKILNKAMSADSDVEQKKLIKRAELRQKYGDKAIRQATKKK